MSNAQEMYMEISNVDTHDIAVATSHAENALTPPCLGAG